MNIFVPVTITGADGQSRKVDFILDSGTNRTTIDRSIAVSLNLSPYRASTNTTPSGTSLRRTALIPHLCSLSQCSAGLEVLVDDLSLYTNGYGRSVGGLLAMDFLEKYAVLIDFPKTVIGFLPADTGVRDFAKFRTLNLVSKEGLALLEGSLPNGNIVNLISDTGFDSPVDALLYQSEIGELDFSQTGESDVKDVNGSDSVKVGKIQWLKIGKIRLKPASIQLSGQISAESSKLGTAGMIGLYPFRSHIIVFDYPNHKLLVSIH